MPKDEETPNRSSDLTRVSIDLTVNEDVSFNLFKELFNEAIYLINSQDISRGQENFYHELGPNTISSNNYNFNAKSTDDYKKAIEILDQIVNIKPAFSPLYVYLGFAKYKLGQYSEALKDYDTALTINSEYAEAYYYRAKCKVANFPFTGNENAIDDFTNAIDIAPKFSKAYYYRAREEHRLGELTALADYNKAIKLNPHNEKAFYYRGVFVSDFLGNHQSAIKSLNEAIEINQDYSDAYLMRGLIYIHFHKFDLATKSLNKVIEISPDNPDAYLHRGVIKKRLGRKKEAIRDFGESIEHGGFEALNRRGDLYLELSRYSAAVDDFTKIIEILPGCTKEKHKRGKARALLGNYELAIKDFSRAIKSDPDYADAYLDRAKAKSKIGDAKGAKEDFRQYEQLK